MKNAILTFILFLFCTGLSAQRYNLNDVSTAYSQPMALNVSGAKRPAYLQERKKIFLDSDTAKYLAGGITLGFNIGLIKGFGSGTFYYAGQSFALDNSFGYSIGFSPGLHNKSYGFEFPLFYNRYNFKVPSLGEYSPGFSEWEFALLNYFKFVKETNFFILGNSFSFAPKSGGALNGLYFTLGYGCMPIKKLTLSVRLNLNMLGELNSIDYCPSGIQGDAVNSWRLVLKYEIASARKMKTRRVKKQTPKNYQELPPPPVAEKVAVTDYSSFRTNELKEMLKDASTENDLDAMLAIQKELDARKTKKELSGATNEELKIKLDQALQKEDYKEAEIIKKELENRGTNTETPEKKEDSLENKSIPELEKLRDEAVAKEDYKTAKEIQDIINSKKEK